MKKIFLTLFIAIVTATTFAQTTKNANTKDGIAIQGYDTVAYFESSKAVLGQKEISTNFKDAVYYFSSENNKALFLKNPDKYVPQFGGFCAYGMSNGYDAPIQAEAFTIVDNKLYLNYNLKVKEMWLKEQTERIEKANVNWEKRNKK